jgi:LmbE family N-acetylglucosaminyl deacetylase
MPSNKTVLSLGAHPDDAEFFCAGTLTLLRQQGWEIHIATMTPGDCGTVQYSREEISRIRKKEAVNAAAILDGQYHCLECDDVFIMYDRPTLLQVIKLIREIQPTLVITLCAQDYMVDHTTTGKLAMTGCFCCGIPNIEIEDVESFEPVPYLYYMDPADGKDNFGQVVTPQMVVDISSAFDTKKQMLSCHESQRNWLMVHHGMDEYIEIMKRSSVERGKAIGASFGEGFRQHLGHAFPQDNILKTELSDRVHEL